MPVEALRRCPVKTWTGVSRTYFPLEILTLFFLSCSSVSAGPLHTTFTFRYKFSTTVLHFYKIIPQIVPKYYALYHLRTSSKMNRTELNWTSQSCVKVEVAVLGSTSLTVIDMVSVDVKQHWTWTWLLRELVWLSGKAGKHIGRRFESAAFRFAFLFKSCGLPTVSWPVPSQLLKH